MMGRRAAIVGLLFGAVTAVVSAGREDPLNKVVELLDSLAAKITKQGEAEEKAYKEFVEWCDDASKNKKFELQTATTKKAELEASIGKLAGEAEAAAGKIEELAGSIAADEGDLKSATEIRQKESADFAASEAELVESIDTLGRAVTIIERQMRKNPAAFAQVDTTNLNNLVTTISAVVDAASFSAADKQKLSALVQRASDTEGDEDMGAPAAAAYVSHSSNILDVLEDLKEKAEEQLASLRKAEVNAKHNYEMLKQSIEGQMANDAKEKSRAEARKSAAEEAKASAQGDLAQTQKTLADGEAALETVNGNCMTTAADHEETVKAREEELKVIAQAKQALKESTAGAVAQTYSFLQGTASVGSRLRTRSDLARAEVVTLVRKLAKESHSAALAQLASRIAAVQKLGAAAGEDPFAKVRSLITDMIRKLESEAGSEATEKAYCDEQLSKTETKKGELEYDLAKLTSKIDKAAAASTGLKADVKEFQAELAALTKSQAEMDKIRYESHEDYVEAKAELQQGLEGVRKALSVLREYYGSGASASMLQEGGGLAAAMQQPAAPEKHAKASGAGSSIIGMLEVVESDFAKSLAAEETEEADAESEYQKSTQENKITKTLKEQDVKYATQEYKNLDKTIAELSSDRDNTDTELAAVMDYYAKIKERCIAKPETFEERSRRRQAEITGLKDALRILEEESSFTQRGKRGSRGSFLGFRQ